MHNLRLVILDYPKLLLHDRAASQAFFEMIKRKQENFQRASDSYVTLGPLDMISTHILIYDCTKIFEPKQVLAMRVCFENRTRKHGLSLPIESYYKAMPPEGIDRFLKFKETKPLLVDCNAWYVDPDYGFSKTKLPLSDLGFFAVALTILRRGLNHLCGCSNEKFKASRWVNKIGNLIEPVTFVHPVVPTIHQLVLLDGFSKIWLTECFSKYGDIISNASEFVPNLGEIGEEMRSIEEIRQAIVTKDLLPAAA